MPSSETDSVVVAVRATPRSSRSEIVGEVDGVLKVRIKAAPVDGAANVELIRLLAKRFGVARSDVSIITGETSRNKRVRISNLSLSKTKEFIK